MVAPNQRSRKRRLIHKKIPSGKVVQEYKRRKPSRASCAGCGKYLHGIPNERPAKMQHMPKTQKRPDRPFGGMLCSPCSREAIKADIEYQ